MPSSSAARHKKGAQTEEEVPGGLASLLRELAPQVLGSLARRHGQFDLCEDAVQEALLAAARQWPEDGLPDSPRAWLTAVATRRLTDTWRSESARRRREDTAAALQPADAFMAPDASCGADAGLVPGDAGDDTLSLLMMCCHPTLALPAQLALTLRAVGGLSAAEIAGAFFVPEATMAQRISRAKARIRADGLTFGLPPQAERAARLRVVLHVLYLMFNEGYTTSSGPVLHRSDLTGEAIRLVRMAHRLLPDDAETAGLLALMLLTEARRPARTNPDGSLVPLAEQDRARWDRALIDEGIALITRTLGSAPAGPYQLQAAIAALHDEAVRAEDTDWAQILALYGVLEHVAPGPAVTLNRAVAMAMVDGPLAGLSLLGTLDPDDRVVGQHRIHAVRGHLLEMAGQPEAARASYRRAARATLSVPEQRYLLLKAAALGPQA